MGSTVRVRKRKVQNGKMSNLYLDLYYTRGVRKRETLEGLQVYNRPKNPLEKDHNKTVELLAEEIRLKRSTDLHLGRKFIKPKKVKLLPFFVQLMRERSGTNYSNWDSCFKHLENYAHPNTLLDDIDSDFVNRFKNYLLVTARTKSNSRLSNNSCISYFNKFRACINEAFEKGLIETNPLRGTKSIKQQETQRVYLNEDEIKLLSANECRDSVLKDAFLFSCFTGLRFSDIYKLQWSDIIDDGEGFQIQFKQQKTKTFEYHPLSKTAFSIIEVYSHRQGKVFRSLRYSGHKNQLLREWVFKSGIKKHVTFHSARHTFATLVLSKTQNIYLVSKLLGHSEIKTTTIYAKIVNQEKRDAVELLNF